MSLHCLTKMLLKHLIRRQKQKTFVELGVLRVNIIYVAGMKYLLECKFHFLFNLL